MRKELKKINEVRATFTATFERMGTKSSFGHPKPTLLFKDVRDSNGKIVSNHLWFNYTMGFMRLGLQAGDVVQFDARVKAYEEAIEVGARMFRIARLKPLQTQPSDPTGEAMIRTAYLQVACHEQPPTP